jgi:zinc protease
VPEGEMIRLLERQGLAFGADTNASTGFEQTTYRLDLPRISISAVSSSSGSLRGRSSL